MMLHIDLNVKSSLGILTITRHPLHLHGVIFVIPQNCGDMEATDSRGGSRQLRAFRPTLLRVLPLLRSHDINRDRIERGLDV